MNMEIKVGLGTCGISAGGDQVYKALKKILRDKKLDIRIFQAVNSWSDRRVIEVIVAIDTSRKKITK